MQCGQLLNLKLSTVQCHIVQTAGGHWNQYINMQISVTRAHALCKGYSLWVCVGAYFAFHTLCNWNHSFWRNETCYKYHALFTYTGHYQCDTIVVSHVVV